MAPIDVRPVAAQAPSRMDVAANVDGPWAQPEAAIRVEVALVVDVLRRLSGLPTRDRIADGLVGEQFALGVFTAARWTLGLMRNRPMDGVEAPVCDAEVNGQLRHARRLVECDGVGWDFAWGVLSWLQWLTGGIDEIRYPRLP